MFRWLRSLFGGGRGFSSTRVRSRVQLGSIYEPPQHVLRVLRQLDDSLDLFVLPDARAVWLLQMVPDRARIIEGRKQLEVARAEGFDEPMFAEQLMAQGFCQLSEDTYLHGHSAGFMEQRAQRVLYATETELREEMKKRRAFADSSHQETVVRAILSDRIRSNARGDWARTYRGRRYFGYGHASR